MALVVCVCVCVHVHVKWLQSCLQWFIQWFVPKQQLWVVSMVCECGWCCEYCVCPCGWQNCVWWFLLWYCLCLLTAVGGGGGGREGGWGGGTLGIMLIHIRLFISNWKSNFNYSIVVFNRACHHRWMPEKFEQLGRESHTDYLQWWIQDFEKGVQFQFHAHCQRQCIEAHRTDLSAQSVEKSFCLHFLLIRMGSHGPFMLCTASSRCSVCLQLSSM